MLEIVIIGAGAAGIAAATKLSKSGINVRVLEAENRIGGRINTIPFAKGVADVGAQWCHGEQNNVVYEICSKIPETFGSTGDVYASFILIRSNKEIVSSEITTRLTALVSDILEAAKYDLIDSDYSFGTYLNQEFDKFLEKPEYNNINKKIAYEFFEFYKKFECSVDASDCLEDISGKGYNEYWECKGDPVMNWKNKGYVSFLRILMNSTPKEELGILKDKISFQKKVSAILWSRKKGQKVKINCTDSEEIYADHVLWTGSLGVLKENCDKIFQPNLPTEKTNAIKGLGFGTVNKIYLEFEEKFWPNNWPGFSILWDKSELENIMERKDSWIIDLFGFYTDYQENVLCGWISGKKAREMENFSDDDILESCLFLLRKFLNWEIPQILNMKRSSWFNNENFRGSYSFQSVLAESLNAQPKDLARPIFNDDGIPILLFAGEATHDHYFSTVHGAVESGWREADRLIKHYSEDNFSDVLILGCGLSGLGAAYALQNRNLKISIMEAQNYVGGRVLTTHLKGLNNKNLLERIDAGAQWLHGEHNLLYKLGIKYNLIDPRQSEEGLGEFYEENGNIIENEFVQKINSIVKNILEDCESFTDSEDYPKSVENFLQKEFQKIFEKEINDPKKYEQALKLLNWHRNFQIIDNSSIDLNKVSAKAWGLYSLNGENCQAHINIKNGFSSLLKVILKEIKPFTKIYLNKIARRIIWKYKYGNEDIIRVETTENEVFYTKNVIVTFSIGVLQSELQLFKPELPSVYRKAISDIGFETINKIFLQFECPWWEESKGIQFIWNDLNNDANKKKLHWTRYLTGFDVLNPGPKNTLVGWIGSYGAKEMEKLTDKEIIEHCVKVLKEFTKKEVPNPISYLCTRWGNNQFIKGGYSFISTNYDSNRESRGYLRKPINIGNSCSMIFAGEACHDNYFSTAHGAFLSGLKQAKLINTCCCRRNSL